MELTLPDPLRQEPEDDTSTILSSSPTPSSATGYTSMIDSVLRGHDLEDALANEDITWDFLLSRPGSASSSVSSAPLPSLSSAAASRRESLTSSVPSDLLYEERYDAAESSMMTSVGPVSSVSLLPSSVESSQIQREGLLIDLEDEMPSLSLPELASPSSTLTEDLMGDSDEATADTPPPVAVQTPLTKLLLRLRSIADRHWLLWRLAFVALTLLNLVRPLDEHSAFESATGFEPSYVEIPVRKLNLTAELAAPVASPLLTLPEAESVEHVEATTDLGGSTVLLFALLVIAAVYVVRRQKRSTSTPPVRAKRVAPRNTAPAPRTPSRAATPVRRAAPRASPPAVPARRSLGAEETEVELEETCMSVNVCLFGSPGVGVSSLIARQVWDEDAEDCDLSSVGHRQSYKRKGATAVYLTLCDWADERTKTQIGRHGLHIALVVFAIDDQGSLAEAQQRVRQIRSAAADTGSLRAIHIIANKIDLLKAAGPAKSVRMTHTRRRAVEWTRAEGLPLWEVDAGDKRMVEDLFRTVAREVRESAATGAGKAKAA